MKKYILIITYFLCTDLIFGQQIKYDTTSFDYGQITEDTEVNTKFWFTNIGTEPLIITNATTGDGGSMATYKKEPVLPGQKSYIIFHYNTKRIGKFQKCISVYSNSKKSVYGCGINVKGDVVRKVTTIKVNHNEINIGEIKFGNIDTVLFEVTNTGKEKLYLWALFNKYSNYLEADMFYYQILSKDKPEKEHDYGYIPFDPNETVQIKILLRNVYGNSGHFERNLLFGYNSYDTLLVTIKGDYVGIPSKRNIYESDCILYYDKDKLLRKESYSEQGNLDREDYFTNSYCVHSKRYNTNKKLTTEYFLEFGKIIDSKKYKVDGY